MHEICIETDIYVPNTVADFFLKYCLNEYKSMVNLGKCYSGIIITFPILQFENMYFKSK